MVGSVGTGAQTVSGRIRLCLGHLEYQLRNNWLVTASTLIGTDRSYSNTIGGLCGSCALLALTERSIRRVLPRPTLPERISSPNLPLTPGNALDPFHPRRAISPPRVRRS